MTRRHLLAVAMLLPARPAMAEDEGYVAEQGGIRVVHAWSQATAAEDGAVLMEIESLSGGDRLTGASSGLAWGVEIHGAVLENGEQASRLVGAIEIPAGGEFVREPEGVFLKLFGLARPLVQGQAFAVRLTFAEAGDLDVHVEVEAAGASQHGHAGHAH